MKKPLAIGALLLASALLVVGYGSIVKDYDDRQLNATVAASMRESNLVKQAETLRSERDAAGAAVTRLSAECQRIAAAWGVLTPYQKSQLKLEKGPDCGTAAPSAR